MSGVEVVGLALAFWPVFGTLRELYKSAKDGTSSRWLMTIKVQERIFKECVLKLLQGDEVLSEMERVGLINGDSRVESLWQEREFSIRLESRLDPEMCTLIKHEVDEIAVLVKGLHKMLGDPKPRTDATTAKSFSLPTLRDVKRVLKREDIKKAVDNLAFHNAALRRLLKTCSSTLYAGGQKPAATSLSRSTAQTQQRKRIDAQFFNDFHDVLCKSFHCHCAEAHEANLSVSDTLVIFPAKDVAQVNTEPRLRRRTSTMESAVTVFGVGSDDQNSSEWKRSTWSRTPQTSQSTAPSERPALLLKYSESRGLKNSAPIPDLCQWMYMLGSTIPAHPAEASEQQGVLGIDTARRYTVQASTKQALLNIVPMEEWLVSGSAQRQRRRVRAELAANLASTILQFYPTAWIEKSWTWSNFSIAHDDAAAALNLVITQQFWSLKLPRAGLEADSGAVPSFVSARPASRFWSTFRDLDPLLVRLGFALIELALGRRLSDLRQQQDKDGKAGEPPSSAGDADLSDYYTAVGVLDSHEIEDEIGVAYQRVVEACLRCRVFGDGGLQPLISGSARFEEDLEQFVVEPLRRHHASTWGVAQRPIH